MTSELAWKALRTWIASQVAPIPVVQAFQNAPAPAVPYIAVARPTLQLDSTEERIYTGTSTLSEAVRNHYDATCQVWAVVADNPTEYATDILRRAFALRAHTVNVKALSKAGISIREVRGPNDVPRVNGSSYVHEAVSTIRFSFSHTQSATVGKIQTETITSNIVRGA